MNLLLALQPTPFCNLACRYCWAPDRQSSVTMPLGVLQTTLRSLATNQHLDRVDVLWLTGEPLAAGLPYFEDAVATYKDELPAQLHGQFLVQTNGTLLSDCWAAFFAEHDFWVGVSIDGPPSVHNLQRPTKAGRDSYDRVLRGVDTLRRHGIKGGALCVIAPATLTISPDELFAFFHDRGIAWSYLIESRIGENASGISGFSRGDLPKVEQFLGRLLDLWASHPESYVRDFDTIARRLFGQSAAAVDLNSISCFDILNVTADGHYYWGNPELMSAVRGPLRNVLGDVASIDPWTFRSTLAFKQFERSVHAGIGKCMAECEYFTGCGGGNAAHKYYEAARFDISSHLTCELNEQAVMRLLVERLERGLAHTNPREGTPTDSEHEADGLRPRLQSR